MRVAPHRYRVILGSALYTARSHHFALDRTGSPQVGVGLGHIPPAGHKNRSRTPLALPSVRVLVPFTDAIYKEQGGRMAKTRIEALIWRALVLAVLLCLAVLLIWESYALWPPDFLSTPFASMTFGMILDAFASTLLFLNGLAAIFYVPRGLTGFVLAMVWPDKGTPPEDKRTKREKLGYDR